VEPGFNTRSKLHQKVGVAVGGVKVTGPCRRAKHLQPPNAVALADSGNAGAVLGDGGMHGRSLIEHLIDRHIGL